jgi:cell division protein FtsI (penicillin-binding protein 3)
MVRLSNPSGSYYGGATAAPVTKAVIEAAVASPLAALDRGRLAASSRQLAQSRLPAGSPAAASIEQAGESMLSENEPQGPAARSERVVVVLPARDTTGAAGPPRAVPNVQGMSVRDAVRTLHMAGFRVRCSPEFTGRISVPTTPVAGMLAPAGSFVLLSTSANPPSTARTR